MSAPSSTPSIAELRAATQPASIFARNSGEHWAGRLYVRRFSPYLTRRLLGTRVTPNAVTWAMIAVGLAAAAVLTLPGVLPALRRRAADPGPDPARLRRRRARALAAAVLARRHLPRPARPLRDRDGAADRARDPRRRRLGRDRRLHDARPARGGARAAGADGERARARRARGGGQAAVEDTAAVAAPRASGAAPRCAARSACSRSSARSSRSRRRCSRSPRRCSTSRSATCEATRVLVIALVPVAAITAVGRLFAILGSERLR